METEEGTAAGWRRRFGGTCEARGGTTSSAGRRELHRQEEWPSSLSLLYPRVAFSKTTMPLPPTSQRNTAYTVARVGLMAFLRLLKGSFCHAEGSS